ncbi:MAG: hypothetical protein IH619_00730 [Ignavibacterium sp.]|nr:hypothetical protein [Ignavibacterium sp.]
MKKYKNLQLAFLIEMFVGFGTILSISIIGPKGLAALAILALRPIILEKEIIKDEKTYFQFFYKIIQNSLSIIFIMIVSLIIIMQFIPLWNAKLPPSENLLVIILPFFLLTHGVIGLMNYSNFDKKE